MKKNLFIFGCSGVGKSIIDTLDRLDLLNSFDVIFVETDPKYYESLFYKHFPVIPQSKLLDYHPKDQYFIISFFKPSNLFTRQSLFDELINKFSMSPFTVVDPTAVISRSADIGSGVYVAPRVIVDASSKIGSNSIILFNSVISREVSMGDNCFISASVVLKGSVTIGESVFISAGCLVTKNIDGPTFSTTESPPLFEGRIDTSYVATVLS